MRCAHFPQWRRIWCREKTCELRCISGAFFWGAIQGHTNVIWLSIKLLMLIFLLHTRLIWYNSNFLQSVNQHLKKMVSTSLKFSRLLWRTRHRNDTLAWQNLPEHRDTVPVVFQIVATQNLELYIHVPFSWGCYISFPGIWNLMVSSSYLISVCMRGVWTCFDMLRERERERVVLEFHVHLCRPCHFWHRCQVSFPLTLQDYVFLAEIGTSWDIWT